MKSALLVAILSVCSVANAVPDLPVVGVNTNNLRAGVGSGYGGAPGYIATVDLDGPGVYDGFVRDAKVSTEIFLWARIFHHSDWMRWGFPTQAANGSTASRSTTERPETISGGLTRNACAVYFRIRSACTTMTTPMQSCGRRMPVAEVSIGMLSDYRKALARYQYCANLDAMLNYTHDGFGNALRIDRRMDAWRNLGTLRSR